MFGEKEPFELVTMKSDSFYRLNEGLHLHCITPVLLQ